MKYLKGIMLILGGMLCPVIITMVMTGTVQKEPRKMNVEVRLRDGNVIDGEQFVMGMAAAQLKYIKEEEAMKAWMIVCRTNFEKAIPAKETIKQDELSLDYISMEELEKNNGRKAYTQLKNALEEASEETFGQVICYGESQIDALYHPVSIGKTVSSKEIYSVEVPYLISVDSSQDVESEEYMQIDVISYEECAKKIKEAGFEETKESCKKAAIEEQTENGFVKKIKTQKNSFTGDEWKKIFGLNSINFYVEDFGGQLRIVTMGKGHDMGMSLYGADCLAKKGLKSAMILSYYYPGTEIKRIKSDNK